MNNKNLNIAEIRLRAEAILHCEADKTEKFAQVVQLMGDFITSISSPKNGFATAKQAQVIRDLFFDLTKVQNDKN